MVFLNTFLEVESLSGLLHFRGEAERNTRWRSLCPEAPGVAGVTERSPEGTEERRAPYTEVCTALPQRALPSDVLGHKRQDLLAEAFLLKMTVLRYVISFEDFDLECPPPPLSSTLRRGTSGNSPFLDFLIWGAGTRRGLILPISLTLRTAREKSLKSRRLFLRLLKPVDDCVNRITEQARRGIGASSRKTLSLSLIWYRVNHKCLSVATKAAIDRPIALAVSLVARSEKSVALRNLAISSFFISSPSSISLSRSVWYACNQPPAWPAAVYAFPTKAEEVWRDLVANSGDLREDASPGKR